MHLEVALATRDLGRTRCGDDCGIDHRAGLDRQALRAQAIDGQGAFAAEPIPARRKIGEFVASRSACAKRANARADCNAS